MTAANPNFIGQNNLVGATDSLFLKVFSGEVLTAFKKNTVAYERTRNRTISHGKSASFAVTGRQSAAYHTAGAELLGTSIPMSEQVITIDGKLVADVFIDDLDEAMNHFDVRSIYSNECGLALAYAMDQNILQVGVQAARSANPISTLPGGSTLVNANYKTSSSALASGLFGAAQALDEKSVRQEGRNCFIRPAQYYLLAQDTQNINRLWGGQGAYADGSVVKIAGIELVPTIHLPITNVTAANAKYSVNAANTAALIMTDEAVGTVKLLDLNMRVTPDPRRLGTLIAAWYASGHGVLRPEAAVELATA